MKNFIYLLLYKINFDKFIDALLSARTRVRLVRYRRSGVVINFIEQGGYELMISGDIKKFKIDISSHLKSDTFIESSGGVTIGKYFHTGRGLTIFSSNHNYKFPKAIPYDDEDINSPVKIEDFVWLGANVTILPGVTIGEGAVVGAGSVVVKNIPKYAIAGGNPARVIKYRDIEHFKTIKEQGFFQ